MSDPAGSQEHTELSRYLIQRQRLSEVPAQAPTLFTWLLPPIVPEGHTWAFPPNPLLGMSRTPLRTVGSVEVNFILAILSEESQTFVHEQNRTGGRKMLTHVSLEVTPCSRTLGWNVVDNLICGPDLAMILNCLDNTSGLHVACCVSLGIFEPSW